MKRYLCCFSVLTSVIFTLYYLHFEGLFTNKSALSTVGLEHPVLFIIWGFLTYAALAVNLIFGYMQTKYKFYITLLIISFIGIMLTVFCDFDYDKRVQYILHCAGSLTFSAVTGICVFLLFLLNKRYISAVICAVVLIVDLICLFIFKETALIEIIPIFTGYILLLNSNLRKERKTIEAYR